MPRFVLASSTAVSGSICSLDTEQETSHHAMQSTCRMKANASPSCHTHHSYFPVLYMCQMYGSVRVFLFVKHVSDAWVNQGSSYTVWQGRTAIGVIHSVAGHSCYRNTRTYPEQVQGSVKGWLGHAHSGSIAVEQGKSP